MTGILTAKTTATKTQSCVTIDLAIPTPNSLAKMVDVYQNSGCAISITIVGTIQMNLLTYADRRIAPLDGEGVQDNLTTDAFQNGFSAMVKTIAETVPTSWQKTVLPAVLRLTLLVKTNVAFQSNGCVILLMTVAMGAMKLKQFASTNTENVRNLSSNAATESVFPQDGAATTKTIAGTTQTKTTAEGSSARMERSSASPATVSRLTSDVMVIEIVEIYQMRLDVRQDTRTEDTALRAGKHSIFISIYNYD